MPTWSMTAWSTRVAPETSAVDLTQHGLVGAGELADVADESVSVGPGQRPGLRRLVHQSVGVAQDRQVPDRHTAAHDRGIVNGLHGCGRGLPGRQADMAADRLAGA